jgi:23S rRNA G2445 N2-methylase RlmL
MALTAQVVGASPNCITFLASYDGAGGAGALTITAAQLAAAAEPGALKDFLAKEWAANNQANARKRLLGEGAAAALGQPGDPIEAVDHCRIFIRNRTAAAAAGNTLSADADVDGADALKNELNLSCQAIVAGSWLVDVEYSHTLVR